MRSAFFERVERCRWASSAYVLEILELLRPVDDVFELLVRDIRHVIRAQQDSYHISNYRILLWAIVSKVLQSFLYGLPVFIYLIIRNDFFDNMNRKQFLGSPKQVNTLRV